MDFLYVPRSLTSIIPLLGLVSCLATLLVLGLSLAFTQARAWFKALPPTPPKTPVSLHRHSRLKQEGLLVSEHGTLLSLVRLHERLRHRYGYATTRLIVVSSALADVLDNTPMAALLLKDIGLICQIDHNLPSHRLGICVSGPGPRRTIWLRARRITPIDLRRLQLGELTESEIWRHPSRSLPKITHF